MNIAIDPGLRWCGVALGVLGTQPALTKAALIINPERTARGPKAWRAMAVAVWEWARVTVPFPQELQLHVEVPRYYPRERYVAAEQNVDPNDLIELSGVVGALSGWWPVKAFYYPSDWKGQVPKKIMTERIRKKLRPEELDNIISVGARDHNTLDAVGIFLHSCGRL